MPLDINNALKDKCLGFIGAGNMAESMIRGIIQNQVVLPDRILASDVSGERRKHVSKTFDIQTFKENRSLVDQSNVIFLAVKPQAIPRVLDDIGTNMGPEKLLISIVAGVPIQTLSAGLPKGPRIVRTMPNTPVTVMEGAMAIASDSPAHPEDLETVETLFRPIGRTVRVEEKLIDAVTGLSGSGPAYVFYFAESMIDAGIKLGLDPKDAVFLATRTFNGAVKLLEETGEAADVLRKKVTSPGGTTEAALKVMEEAQVKDSIIDAVFAAAKRSKELS